MLAAVAEYAGILEAEPGTPFTTIYGRACAVVPATSLPAISEGLPEALGNIEFVISTAESWERANLATAIVMAIAKVADAVAGVPAGFKPRAARAYSATASRTAGGVGAGAAATVPGIPQHPDPINNKSSPAGTSPTSCDAVLQAAQLQAALYAVQRHTEQVGHVQAINALSTIASSTCLSGPVNEWPSTTCACDKDAGGCQAVVRVRRMRGALQALWRYHIEAGDRETVYALDAVATGACFPSPPERPVVSEQFITTAATARISRASSPPPGYSADF